MAIVARAPLCSGLSKSNKSRATGEIIKTGERGEWPLTNKNEFLSKEEYI